MKRKKTQRRGIAGLPLTSPTTREKRNQSTSIVPAALSSGGWQMPPLVSGLINYFKSRKEKRRASKGRQLGLGMRRLSNEPLEARCLLSISYVDNPGVINPFTHYAGDWYVQTDSDSNGILSAGDIVTWQKGVSGKEQADLVWDTNAFGTISSAVGASPLRRHRSGRPRNFHHPIDKNDFGSKVLTLQGYGATGSNATILNGDHANIGVDIENGASVSISGFEIQNWVTGVYVSNANLTLNNSIVLGANSSTDYYGVSVLGGTANIANSTITGTYYGVSAGGASSGDGQAFISGSNLAGNQIGLLAANLGSAQITGSNLSGYTLPGQKAVVNDNSAATIDASGNYWGSTDESTVMGLTSGKVDFSPYLAAGSATQPATGFSGDQSTLYVTSLGQQTGSSGRIQEGIGLLADGSLTGSARVVHVEAGTYAENILINKPLTLLGAQAGQDANARFATFINGPNGPKASQSVESIITAPSVDTANNDLVRIVSDDVTVDGFVVDGNNPSLGTSGALKINGAGPYVDARNGIDTLDPATGGQAVNGLLIENNIVQNVAHDGIALINPSNTSAVSSGSLVTGNVAANFLDYGVLLAYNAYGDVTYNTIYMPDLAEAGVWVYDFTSNGSSPKTINVSHNNVTVGQDAFGGIWGNLLYPQSAVLNIADNTVNAAAGVTGDDDYTYGIYLTSLQNGMGANLTGNIIGSSGGSSPAASASGTCPPAARLLSPAGPSAIRLWALKLTI